MNKKISTNPSINLIFDLNKVDPSIKKFNVIETFAGIGAQHKALKEINSSRASSKRIDFQIVLISEWEIFALLSYVSIHHTWYYDPKAGVLEKKIINHINKMKLEEKHEFLLNLNLSRDSKSIITNYSKYDIKFIDDLIFACIITRNIGDINFLKDLKFNELPHINLLTYSFPCTDLSNQGKQKGLFESERSSLLWQIDAFVKKYKSIKFKCPDFLLMENVPSISGKKFSAGYDLWKSNLKEYGYENEDSIENSINYDRVGQVRKRTFMVSYFLSPEAKYKELNKSHFFNIQNPPQTRQTIGDFVNRVILYKHNEKGFEDIIPFSEIYKSSEQLKQTTDVDKLYQLANEKSVSKKTSFVFEEFGTFRSEYKVQLLSEPSSTITATGALSRLKIFDNNKNDIKVASGFLTYLLTGFDLDDAWKVYKYLFQMNKYGNNSHDEKLGLSFDDRKEKISLHLLEMKEFVIRNDKLGWFRYINGPHITNHLISSIGDGYKYKIENYIGSYKQINRHDWKMLEDKKSNLKELMLEIDRLSFVKTRNGKNLFPTKFPLQKDEIMRKQAGNSIVVQVIQNIMDNISKIWIQNKSKVTKKDKGNK